MTNLRIGQGYDLHRTCSGRKLVLGGVEMDTDFGLDGHSDADALLHAIIDSFLGALALGDIGSWFPDTNPVYKDADSRTLLKTVLDAPEFQEWELANLDCTIFTELPKIGPYRQTIRQSLANLLGCNIHQISVKAKTNEKQDAIGAGKALAASATILLQHK